MARKIRRYTRKQLHRKREQEEREQRAVRKDAWSGPGDKEMLTMTKGCEGWDWDAERD